MAVLLPTGKQAPVSVGVKLPEELEKAILDVIHTAVHKTAQDIRHADKFPEYMNQRTAAKYLGTSPATLINWEKADIGFPTIYIEGSKHYSKAALDKWMKSKQKQSN